MSGVASLQKTTILNGADSGHFDSVVDEEGLVRSIRTFGGCSQKHGQRAPLANAPTRDNSFSRAKVRLRSPSVIRPSSENPQPRIPGDQVDVTVWGVTDHHGTKASSFYFFRGRERPPGWRQVLMCLTYIREGCVAVLDTGGTAGGAHKEDAARIKVAGKQQIVREARFTRSRLGKHARSKPPNEKLSSGGY